MSRRCVPALFPFNLIRLSKLAESEGIPLMPSISSTTILCLVAVQAMTVSLCGAFRHLPRNPVPRDNHVADSVPQYNPVADGDVEMMFMGYFFLLGNDG